VATDNKLIIKLSMSVYTKSTLLKPNQNNKNQYRTLSISKNQIQKREDRGQKRGRRIYREKTQQSTEQLVASQLLE